MSSPKALEALQAAREARKAAGLPTPERRDPIQKAAAKPSSLRLAISAKCYDCQGRDCDPGFRERIRSCVVSRCPLHPVRPYQRDDSDEENAQGEVAK